MEAQGTGIVGNVLHFKKVHKAPTRTMQFKFHCSEFPQSFGQVPAMCPKAYSGLWKPIKGISCPLLFMTWEARKELKV